MYKYYKTENVTVDQQFFLTTSKGLIEEVVCSRALTSEVPMEIDNVCNKQTANLPVVSVVYLVNIHIMARSHVFWRVLDDPLKASDMGH